MKIISAFKSRMLILLRPVTRLLWPAPDSHLHPVSRRWGFERGTPISRHYIDLFISNHSNDIQGDILEVKNRRYMDRHAKGSGKRDVLDMDSTNKNANIIADLARAHDLQSSSYDCFILTETLQYVYELEGAVRHCYRILKQDGVLLVTVPSFAHVDHELADIDCWRFSSVACTKLFGSIFGMENIQVEVYGNFATCVASLSGVAFEELPKDVIDNVDTKYAQGVLVRARKSAILSATTSFSDSIQNVKGV